MAEARGGRWTVDEVESIPPTAEALYREKLTQAVRSPQHKYLIDGALPFHREWPPTLIFIFVLAYNTGKVKKADLPRSYAELPDPKWKDKLSIQASDHEWFYRVLGDMGEERDTTFFRDLVETNGLTTRVGHPLLVNLVA